MVFDIFNFFKKIIKYFFYFKHQHIKIKKTLNKYQFYIKNTFN